MILYSVTDIDSCFNTFVFSFVFFNIFKVYCFEFFYPDVLNVFYGLPVNFSLSTTRFLLYSYQILDTTDLVQPMFFPTLHYGLSFWMSSMIFSFVLMLYTNKGMKDHNTCHFKNISLFIIRKVQNWM